MARILLILVSIFISGSSLKAQDSLENQIGFQFGMTKQDFFTGIIYSRNFSKIQPFTSLEFGVNRTFFQNRIFPRLGIGCTYKALNKAPFDLGPVISYSYSFLKVNKSTNHFHQWNEVYFGYKLTVGRKFLLTNSILCGLMNERYFNQLTQKNDGVIGFGFYVNLGVNYAF